MLPLFSTFLALSSTPPFISTSLVMNYYAVVREKLPFGTPEVMMTTTQQSPFPILYPRLSKTLDSLAYIDQWPQQQMFKQLPDSAGRDLVKVEMANFARHQPLLEKIVRQYGFPGFRQVGKKSANNFWLLVQHADAFPAFQQRVLKLMLPQVKRKNADASDYAYLTDRVARNSGQLSEYGTQVVYKGFGPNIQAVSRPLRDPVHVNQRRAAVGLEPLESYLNSMTNMTRQMNAPKTPANSPAAPAN